VSQINLNDLIGISSLQQRARIQIDGCHRLGIPFPHTLITAVGGVGKTVFARAIGNELGYHFVEVEANVFKNRDQVLKYILDASSSSQVRGRTLLLFIDEIHRLRLQIQEALYIPMKEWRISSRSGDISLRPFTFIGATTRFDMLDANSFVTRFENLWEIERYSETDIGMIIAQEFRKVGLHFSREIVQMISKRCLGIPRNAISFVRKLRFMSRHGVIHLSDVVQMFNLEEIDDLGLHPIHRRYLHILSDRCVPLGVGAIASKMRQPEDMIKGAVEPILLELNMISPTPRGRKITQAGREFLKAHSH